MSLFSSLNTGTSGLSASELGISVTGHNISNANNEYYTRQRVVTSASTATSTGAISIGTGVSVTTIARIHDEFVYTRLKESSGDLAYDAFMKQSLEEVAGYFPDLEDVGLASDIQDYFAAWNDFSSNTDDGAQKIALVQAAETLATNLQTTKDSVRALQDSVNSQLKTNIDEINRIGQEIVDINIAIAKVETVDSNRANDLRDQRDQLELTLAELIDISVFKGDIISENTIDSNLTDQGTAYHMNIAGNSFVDGVTFHPIVIENSTNESNYYSIYSESQDGTKVEVTSKLTGGKVGAMLDLRGRTVTSGENSGFPTDGILQGYIDDLDTFANTFVEQTNNIYAQSAQTRMVSSGDDALEADTALEDYSSNISDGTFDVIIYDKEGNEIARKAITIDFTTTMDDGSVGSIVSQINSNSDDNEDNNSINDVDDYFRASFTEGGRLVLEANSEYSSSGYTVAIEDNGTNFAGVVGMSEFLVGDSADSFDVALEYKTDPDTLNGFSAPIEGNNDVANAMIQMQYETFEFNRANGSDITETIEGFYRFVTTEIATDGEKINSSYETTEALYNTVYSEFQSISGVNIDEELTDLMMYQTAYGANAKVITTIDQMLDTLLGIKQ